MDSVKLAVCSDKVRIWSLPDQTKLYETDGETDKILSASWNHDGSCLASCTANEPDHISLTFAKNNAFTTSEVIGPNGKNSKIQAVLFPGSSQKCLCLAVQDHVMFYDVTKKKVRQDFHNVHDVTCLTMSPNEKYVAGGSQNGRLYVLNPLTSRSAFTQPLRITKDESAITSCKFNNVKHYMIGASADNGCMSLWDLNSAKELQKYHEHNAPATGMAFSPVNDVLFLSSGLDQRCVCYDTLAKKPASTIVTDLPLTCVEFAADGTNLVLGTSRGLVYLYDLRWFESPTAILKAASPTAVSSVLFQPGGERANVSALLSSLSKTNSSIKENLKPSINDENNLSLSSHVFSPARPDLSFTGVNSPNIPTTPGALHLSNCSRLSADSILSPLRETSFNSPMSLPSGKKYSTTPLLTSVNTPLLTSIREEEISFDNRQSIESSDINSTPNLPKKSEEDVKAILTAFPQALESAASNFSPQKQAIFERKPSVDEFKHEFVQAAIEEAMDEFCSDMRKQMWHWHYDMIKAFQQQSQEFRSLLREQNQTQELLEEVRRLRIENEKLKNTPFVANFNDEEK